MAKRLTINKKIIGNISSILSHRLSLNDLKEFEEMDGNKLFEERPEHWREIENVLCEYTTRLHIEIMGDLKKLLDPESNVC